MYVLHTMKQDNNKKTQGIETKSQLQKISVIRKKFYDFSFISYALIFCSFSAMKQNEKIMANIFYYFLCAAQRSATSVTTVMRKLLASCTTATLALSQSHTHNAIWCFVAMLTLQPVDHLFYPRQQTLHLHIGSAAFALLLYFFSSVSACSSNRLYLFVCMKLK